MNMSVNRKAPQKVDVICQHSVDGTIIPLRVRMTDEDGQRQMFNIKEYLDVSHKGLNNTL